MGTVPVPRTEAAHLGLLAAKMEREVEKLLWFNNFTGPVTRTASGELRAPVAPVAELNEFVSKGQDNMLIPVLKNLVGAPFYGDRIATGHGEKQKWDYIKTFVNNIRKPVEGPAVMSNQRIKTFDLVAKQRAQLSLWFAQQLEVQTVAAFYEGFSRNITASTATFGFGVTKRYHPNFYVAGSGKATWSGTSQTHANNIGAKLGSLQDGLSDHFTVDNLENLRAEVQKIPLQPIMVQGKPCFIMLVHHNQMRQLRQDPKYRDSANQGWLRGLQNPVFNAAEAYIANFLIFEREFSVFGVDEGTPSGGNYTLTFGASNPISAVDSYDKKVAIVFGNNAISKGVGSPLVIKESEKDIGAFKEAAINQIVGHAVNTFYDVDPSASTPTTAINQSSALFATFSPDSWS